jgi:flavorubredoxin
MNTQLADNIHWVGFVDWNVRDFHSYHTLKGATYNSYLIQDEKTALIDTVKKPFLKNLVSNIENLTPLEKIDYIIVNHAEPDHSGSLSHMVAMCPNATIICTEKSKQILSSYYDTTNWKFKTVKTNDTISLGKRSLVFIETPMVHWPDSMFSYIPEDKILFSMDAFGQHYSSDKRFDYEVELDEVMEEAKKYYANIVMSLSTPIKQTLEKAKTIDIKMIAPAHGIIWKEHIPKILQAYIDWTDFKPKPKVLIIYDTMWQSTEIMAKSILDGASLDGVEVKLISIRKTDITQIISEVQDAAAIAFGSSTLNLNIMPAMGMVLTYLKGLKPEKKSVFAFGSYGWAKKSADIINQYLQDMNLDIVNDPIYSNWRPTEDVLKTCFNAGQKLGKIASKNIT